MERRDETKTAADPGTLRFFDECYVRAVIMYTIANRTTSWRVF